MGMDYLPVKKISHKYHKYQIPNILHFLPSTNEVCEGYVFAPVCHSVHGGGVSVSVHAGIHPSPSSRHPPPQQTATAADGTHPTGMHSCIYFVLSCHIFLHFSDSNCFHGMRSPSLVIVADK